MSLTQLLIGAGVICVVVGVLILLRRNETTFLAGLMLIITGFVFLGITVFTDTTLTVYLMMLVIAGVTLVFGFLPMKKTAARRGETKKYYLGMAASLVPYAIVAIIIFPQLSSTP